MSKSLKARGLFKRLLEFNFNISYRETPGRAMYTINLVTKDNSGNIEHEKIQTDSIASIMKGLFSMEIRDKSRDEKNEKK